MNTRLGIVDLRDLASRPVANPLRIEEMLVAAGLAVMGKATNSSNDAVWRGFAPPQVLVVLVPYDSSPMLRRARAWLADASHLVIIRDARGYHPIEGDMNHREALAAEWRDAVLGLPPHELIDWLSAEDPAPCGYAVARAVAAVATVPPAPRREAKPIDLEIPPSAWVELASPDNNQIDRALSQIVRRDDRMVLVVAENGNVVDLAQLPSRLNLAAAGEAICPAGTRHVERHEDLSKGYRLVGFDPIHPIGWCGKRSSFYWYYVGAGQVGFLAQCDHDWPCSPSKKLWGYDDNFPRWVHLSPRADVCAAVFDHDVLVTQAIPITWSRAVAAQAPGEAVADIALFTRDPRRAVFYSQTPEFKLRRPMNADPLEEDEREYAPTIVLGPDAAVRYAVDLKDHVVRITRAQPSEEIVAVTVGGPNEGYAVFDADHALVRRGSGRLLGGWHRWATIEDAGAYWREELATGERTLLGASSLEVCVDPGIEASALEAAREGRYADAMRIRASHASRPLDATDDPPPNNIPIVQFGAIPGTRNVLQLVTTQSRQWLRIL